MAARPVIVRVLAAALLAAGCDGEDAGPLQTRENAFTWADRVPAGATLTMRSFNGAMTVEPSPDDSVRVTARVEWRQGDPDRDLRFSASRSGEDAVVCAVWGKGSCSAKNYDAKVEGRGVSSIRVIFTAQVPSGVKVDLLQITGDVTAATTAPVKAQTLNGDVRVVTAVGPVRGESLNGSVDIRMSSLVGTDSVVATTINGDAFIYLSDLTDAVVDLGVTVGKVTSDFPMPAPDDGNGKGLRATIGAGTRVIRGKSLNGEVALRRLDAEGRAP